MHSTNPSPMFWQVLHRSLLPGLAGLLALLVTISLLLLSSLMV